MDWNWKDGDQPWRNSSRLDPGGGSLGIAPLISLSQIPCGESSRPGPEGSVAQGAMGLGLRKGSLVRKMMRSDGGLTLTCQQSAGWFLGGRDE